MNPVAPHSLLIFALISLCAWALLVAAFDRGLRRRAMLLKKAGRLADVDSAISQARVVQRQSETSRKVSIEQSLINEPAGSQAKGKYSLIEKIHQAGLRWSMRTYWLVSGACALGSFLIAIFMFGFPMKAALPFAFAGGAILPHVYVSRTRTKRFDAFAAEFPNALDIIVRGIKSGLPFSDCLKIIGREAQEPVRSEFQRIVEDQVIGLPVAEAMQRLPIRIPTAETRFFSIVMAIQSRTGGNLSEALGNLSNVLRDRARMKAKIRAMSAEAKTSAGIIACLPLSVAGILYLVNKPYISLLFTDPIGHAVLVICGLWMLMGVLVMRKMINFDF